MDFTLKKCEPYVHNVANNKKNNEIKCGIYENCYDYDNST
jgi:hypothetical protein